MAKTKCVNCGRRLYALGLYGKWVWVHHTILGRTYRACKNSKGVATP